MSSTVHPALALGRRRLPNAWDLAALLCVFGLIMAFAQAAPGTFKPLDAPEAPRGNGELLLLVDDEKGVLDMSRIVLERHGYRIETATDGIEGLAYFARHAEQVAAVITGVHMPNFDGISLVKALRQLNPLVPIIGSTGQATAEEEQKLNSLGVDRFLKKPYTKRQLLTAVGQLVAATPAAAH